jgi:Zn-finger nucleic acid-binding protein
VVVVLPTPPGLHLPVNLIFNSVMKCPACFNELTEVQVGAVKVDVCYGGCAGIWFDAFELARVDESHEAAGEHLVNIPRNPKLQVDHNRKRDCPRCAGIKLKRHLFSPRIHVEVDDCPNCGGYWLDAGELKKIREENKPVANLKSSQAGFVTTEVIRFVYRMQAQMRKDADV